MHWLSKLLEYTEELNGQQTMGVEKTSSVLVSGWRTEYRCTNCGQAVSNHEKMYSNGRCPYCGYKGPSNCTIMDVTEHAYRLVRRGKWWQFWIRPFRQYKEADNRCPHAVTHRVHVAESPRLLCKKHKQIVMLAYVRDALIGEGEVPKVTPFDEPPGIGSPLRCEGDRMPEDAEVPPVEMGDYE